MPRDGTGPPATFVTLALVAVRLPTPGDVAPACPRSDRWFAVGSLVHLEVWASAGPQETGLAAVYADTLFDSAALSYAQTVPSESFPLFTKDQPLCSSEERPAAGRLCGVGGCVQLRATELGAGSQWVRVATLQMHARSPGTSAVRLMPADGGYGVAMIDRLGLLPQEEIRFGSCRVAVRKMLSDPAGALNTAASEGPVRP